jgi:hypothetical protein
MTNPAYQVGRNVRDKAAMQLGIPVISMQITTVGRFKPDKALRTGPV